jgi:hypothetical protein
MNFTSVKSALVDILFYRNDIRDWRKPDGAEVSSSSDEGRATVHIIQESDSGYRFRIYAVRHGDNRPLVNQLLYENFHYKVATPVFHQWKNEEKQVIGINFLSTEDALHFSKAIKEIIENLNVPQYQQVNNSNVSNGVYQDPQAYYQQNGSRDVDQESIGSGHSAAMTNYRQQQQKSSYSSLHSAQTGTLNQQQRRCSQGSSGSSGTPSSSNIYATAQPFNASNGSSGPITNGHQSTSNGTSKAPVPPPPPPPPPQQLNGSLGSNNSNGSTNIAQISKTAPPAPPPPPPILSLSDQLKNSTLRKTSVPVNKSPSDTSQTTQQQQQKQSTVQPPNFMSELAAKLGSRNGKPCNADNISTSSSSGVSTASSNMGISSDNSTSDSGATIVAAAKKTTGDTPASAPKPWSKPNGNNVAGITAVANGSTDSPKVKRKIINSNSTENSAVTVADLEQFKQEILAEVNKSKQEMAEIRQEISKVVRMQQEMFEAIRAGLQR